MSDRLQHSDGRNLIDALLAEQRNLTAVERFSALHDRGYVKTRYAALLPSRKPDAGEQYRFEVNLDACTGCKACVVACHSLNGLDDDESFRDVGFIAAGDYQQTVTTACHHCADPACANGCPVRAYEKDATTGIVKHLDDQCIGCQYCLLKCPYEVPKYNKRLGIVRKCDMCVQRLEVGEAPACVQACPTSAISIRLVRNDELPAALVPGAFDPAYTQPATAYTGRPIPADARPADAGVLRVQHTHWPLVAMLLASQLASGWFVASWFTPALFLPACAVLFAGLGASILHLGRPMGAWRFFLGLRRSWMSREILAFSLLANLAGALATARIFSLPDKFPILAPLINLALPGLIALAPLAIFTSAMIYIDTRRAWWGPARSFLSFFGAAIILGSSLTHPVVATIAGISFFLGGMFLKTRCPYSLTVEKVKLPRWRLAQEITMLSAVAFQMIHPPFAFAFWVAGFICERVIFFRAVDSPKMPGGATA